MTAIEVVQKAKTSGLLLTANGYSLTIEGDAQRIEQLRGELIAHKRAILAILQERESIPSAVGAVLAASRLLRRGRWNLEAAPCGFFTGNPRDPKCCRCGGSWALHYPATSHER